MSFLTFSPATGSGKRRRKQDQCCGHLNSLAAIKYAVVSLYILVLLTIFGLCLAGRMKRMEVLIMDVTLVFTALG